MQEGVIRLVYAGITLLQFKLNLFSRVLVNCSDTSDAQTADCPGMNLQPK